MGSIGLKNYLIGNATAGIHLNINADSKWFMSIVILEMKKGLIKISNKITGITSFDEVRNHVSVNLPVILSIDGKGVIHKKINKIENVHLIQQVFPNAQSADFYVQTQGIENGQLIVSLIRNEIILEILELFRVKGYHIYNAHLGPFSINCIWPFLDIHHNDYYIDNYSITSNNKVITNLEITSDINVQSQISIGGDEIENTSLIPYANAFSFFSNNNIGISFSEDIIRPYREQFIYKRTFRYTASVLLVLLFMILLVNFLLFDKFNKRYIQASLEYKSDLELVSTLDSLKKDLELKEALIEENGLITISKYSFYADIIASLVPQQIILTSLEINPVLSRPSVTKELDIKHNLIKIKGKCLYSLILDEWMEVIRKKEWVKRMEVIQYQQENKGSPGEFIIQIEF